MRVQPRRKKRFIDKKKAQKFILVPRSLQDPETYNDDASKFVLHPVGGPDVRVDFPLPLTSRTTCRVALEAQTEPNNGTVDQTFPFNLRFVRDIAVAGRGDNTAAHGNGWGERGWSLCAQPIRENPGSTPIGSG